jgi:hypothetical protein
MSYRVVEVTDPDDPLIHDLHELCERIDGPDTRCAPDAGVPQLELMQQAAQSGDGIRLWAVLDVAFDDEPVAMVITNSEGQFTWLKASLDVIGPATYAAGDHITKAIGIRAWGIMQNDEIRHAIATSGPNAGVDDAEQRVWWNG